MYYIVCNFDIEGFHKWEDAVNEYQYLKQRHRHIFTIKAVCRVYHDNRDIEINKQRNEIINYLNNKYGQPCEFENMSCEAIAKDIAVTFGCQSVEVLEDGYCGAGFINEKENRNEENGN